MTDAIHSREYLQHFVDSFKTPVQVLRPVIENNKIIDFVYILTNEAYAAYTNTTAQQLRGKRVGDVFPGYFKTTSYTKLVEVYESGVGDIWEIHYNQDGLNLYNQMSASRLGDELIVHFTDLTHLKLLQLQLVEKVEQLKKSNEQLDEFTHAASHDLKEPIRKINVFTSRLRGQLNSHLSSDQRFTFEKIEKAADRMKALVDDLLMYSHVSHTIQTNDQVDLNVVLAGVKEDLELDIQQQNAQIVVSELPVVRGNRRQLQQLFQNLISNAIKYSRVDAEPKIVVESKAVVVSNDRHYHVLEVTDNGIGFDQKHEFAIFELFSRLHPRDKYSGTGVGLAIVKKVAENHGGRLEVTSIPGVGSTFRLFLPV